MNSTDTLAPGASIARPEKRNRSPAIRAFSPLLPNSLLSAALAGRDEILYSTQRDLEPLSASSKHRVWSSHLVLFDPATRGRTRITSGLSRNLQPARCATSSNK